MSATNGKRTQSSKSGKDASSSRSSARAKKVERASASTTPATSDGPPASGDGRQWDSNDMLTEPIEVQTPSWAELQMSPSWRILRIMAEFVDGFTFLARIQKSVTLFASARRPETHPYDQMARQLGQALAKRGYTIVTGGGPGIMQAGNQGACEVGGDSVGINIQLPHEQRVNPYVRRSISLNYFFSRKVMLDFS